LVQIGIFTTYDVPSDDVIEKAKLVALKLVEKGCVIITGGDGGVMRVIAEEARRRGGIVVGILSYEIEEANVNSALYNPFNTVEIRTGLTYSARSAIVARSSDAAIVIGGGAGTLTEVCMAYNMGIPLVVLEGTGMVADKLKSMFPSGYLDHRENVKLHFTKDPVEAVEIAYRLAVEKSFRRYRMAFRV